LRLDALKFAKARELVVIYPKFLKACELFQIFEATNLVCSQIQSFERNQMVETSNPLNPIMGQIQFLKLQQVFKAGNFG